MFEASEECLKPPSAVSAESYSTRSLNQLYRQSHGEAFFAEAVPPISPWKEHSPVRIASWSSNLSEAVSEGHVGPRLARNVPSFASERAASRISQYKGAGSRPIAKSTPSFDLMPSTIGGLDLTDPWGFSFHQSSPYDALLPPRPPKQPSSPTRSMSRMSISSASSSPSYNSQAWADRSPAPSTLYTTPSGSSAPPSTRMREIPLPSARPSYEKQDSDNTVQDSTRATPQEVRKISSMSDLPSSHGTIKATPRKSKMQEVRNQDDSLTDISPPVTINKQKKFNWFRKSSTKEAKVSDNKLLAPLPASKPTLPSPSRQHLETPPLSASTSSAASSSIDTPSESALDNHSLRTSPATSPSFMNEPLPPKPDHLEMTAAMIYKSDPGSRGKLSIRSVTPNQVSPQRTDFPIQEPLSASFATTFTQPSSKVALPRPSSTPSTSRPTTPLYDKLSSNPSVASRPSMPLSLSNQRSQTPPLKNPRNKAGLTLALSAETKQPASTMPKDVKPHPKGKRRLSIGFSLKPRKSNPIPSAAVPIAEKMPDMPDARQLEEIQRSSKSVPEARVDQSLPPTPHALTSEGSSSRPVSRERIRYSSLGYPASQNNTHNNSPASIASLGSQPSPASLVRTPVTPINFPHPASHAKHPSGPFHHMPLPPLPSPHSSIGSPHSFSSLPATPQLNEARSALEPPIQLTQHSLPPGASRSNANAQNEARFSIPPEAIYVN